jgi:hypothetical protein
MPKLKGLTDMINMSKLKGLTNMIEAQRLLNDENIDALEGI